MPSKKFYKFVPHHLDIKCKRCGNLPLEIWAFKDKKNVEPCLVCTDCGCFYDICEYDLTEEQLCK